MLGRLIRTPKQIQIISFRPAVRNLSAKNYREPEYIVDTDEQLRDQSIVKIPVLHESVKIEIYKKYTEGWTVKQLAELHKALPDRISAIIYLMKGRQDKMKSLGFEIGGDGYAIVPQDWQKLHDLKKENPTMTLSELAAGAGMEGATDETITKILANMSEHLARMENVETEIKHQEYILRSLAREGVNTEFREDMEGRPSKLAERYFPALFGDEGYEEERRRLLKRLQDDTKAVRIRDFDYYVAKHSEVPKKTLNSEGIEELSPTETQTPTLADIVKPVHDHSRVKHFRRTKLAFRDLSFMNYRGQGAALDKDPDAPKEYDAQGREKETAPDTRRRKNVAKFAAPPATMILTRGGVWRKANPLEEAQRSWTQNPTHFDLRKLENRAKVEAYGLDWDGDEALVKAQRDRRDQHREQLLSQMAGGGKK